MDHKNASFPSVPERTAIPCMAIKHQLFSPSFLSTNINLSLIKLLFLRSSSSNQTLIVLKETDGAEPHLPATR